jgi:cell division protein FtsI/penicillin-binding protein 2
MLVATAGGAAGCGGSSPSPQTTLDAYLRAWQSRDYAAMAKLVSRPPAGFSSVNASLFTGLGTTSVRLTAGRLTRHGKQASAPVTEHFTFAGIGSWDPVTTVHLVQGKKRWLVSWTPATVDPNLQHPGDKVVLSRHWPARAAITGTGASSLVSTRPRVTVGVVGSRIKDAHAVGADLIAAGAPASAVSQALALARAHPSQFEPVFTISFARFEQLKRQAGTSNVYDVAGTQFESASTSAAITPQLAAHLVGTIGPITAEELKALGSPYDASSVVGQTGLEASQERQLAGTPTVRIDVDDASGTPETRLKTWPGTPGKPVRTSLDPRVQRAAEAALAPLGRHAAIVAMRASTGQVLAAVSDPVGYGFDQALQGAYPPGSTFKVLTSTALIRHGLSPSSGASCPPTITVDGETFHNAEGDRPVSSLDAAFTESCNTAFIGLATHDLSAGDFVSTAKLYGLIRSPHMGVSAFDANVPAPHDQAALGATSIGQAQVTFSPLGMATVAAAVDSGAVHAPRLVAGAPDDTVAVTHVPAAVLDGLRLMMGHVVESGTAAGFGLPSGTEAKTGTAEYGPDASKIDGWLMGYHGDIAFAIVVNDTGGVDGGPINGPVIARFFRALGAG